MRAVAQDGGDILQRRTLPQHGRRQANAAANARHLDWGALTSARRNALSTISETAAGRAEGARRRTGAEKQRLGIGPRPTFFQVGHNRLTHFLGQRQSRVTTALTANLNRCILPVDITQAEMHDIARPKTQTGQQQQDRPIPPANS